ncbi:MAG: tRNA 2-thiouridine(34) synthase MnmA [Candidatus Competibacteraceae bacterium]|nr:tRNA 2-thiouridine(34) synthase MnmA [Candidatus Competibacteraceae bacterium]
MPYSPRSKPRVVVGISGGVDSSVAALLLLEAGYEVHGVFMKNWEETFEPGYCSAGEDLRDAQDVCDTLGIPLHTVNFTAEYQQRVFAIFLEEYGRGRTPNPDILCNSEIKFKAFLKYAHTLGAEHIATGHYARRGQRDGRTILLKGLDPGKDQSYFLYALNQSQLERALFPLGELHKNQVRTRAREAELITSDKKDSTGICFIGERPFRAFLNHYLPTRPGAMETPEGETVGEHWGLMFYTLGQRQGLGLGGRAGGGGEPWYVVDKDLARNVLIVAQGGDHPRLYKDCLRVERMHWITSPPAERELTAKIRHRQPDQPCTLTPLEGDAWEVYFPNAQRAITPGQSLVLYRDQECLGGGVIESAYDR